MVSLNEQASRGIKKPKRPWNGFLRTKLLGVLAGGMLKAESPRVKMYEDYKHRMFRQQLERGWGLLGEPWACKAEELSECAAILKADLAELKEREGLTLKTLGEQHEAQVKQSKKATDDHSNHWDDARKATKEMKNAGVWNIGHQHQAAIRYMIKQLIADFYVPWRQCAGLTVRVPYAEEYLGRKHGG